MKTCLYCAHKNREGLLFCEECGQSLQGNPVNATLPTRQLEEEAAALSAKATWGTARFGQESAVVIHIRDATEPIILSPAKRTLLGRLIPQCSSRM
jgi:hypothetical protein